MKLKTCLLLTATLATCVATTAWADDEHTFPEAGKTYIMHRYNDQNSYVYENSSGLFAGPMTNTQKQYWQFVPTEKANCYYIQNVTSKRYVQSTAVTSETQIKVGATPVEFEIKQNTTDGAAPKGYYYICSTDQAIDNTKDGTLGLNYQQSSGKVVAFHIRYNRPNSYWDINETTYDYEAPAPIERSAYCKRLGIYVLPCGSKGAAYLNQLSITGELNNVPNTLNYTATTQPANYYNLVRTDSAEVVKGSPFHLNFEASGMTAEYTVTAYFDWDKDGVFEAQHDFLNAANGSAEVVVPDTAAYGRVRMRVRITDNGLEGADDEVNGATYDFQLFVVDKNAVTHTDHLTSANNTQAIDQGSHAYAIDGRRVNLSTHKGLYIQAKQKHIK